MLMIFSVCESGASPKSEHLQINNELLDTYTIGPHIRTMHLDFENGNYVHVYLHIEQGRKIRSEVVTPRKLILMPGLNRAGAANSDE